MTTLAELDARLRVQEDIEDIRRLKSLYCRICDCGWDKPGPDGMGLKDIFTEDGVWDTSVSVIKVHESNRRPGGKSPFKMGVHYSICGSIEVNGDTAKGFWHGLVPNTNPAGVDRWTAGIYEETYQRTPEGWKYKHMKFHPAFMAPHLEGWGAHPLPTPEELEKQRQWMNQ